LDIYGPHVFEVWHEGAGQFVSWLDTLTSGSICARCFAARGPGSSLVCVDDLKCLHMEVSDPHFTVADGEGLGFKAEYYARTARIWLGLKKSCLTEWTARAAAAFARRKERRDD